MNRAIRTDLAIELREDIEEEGRLDGIDINTDIKEDGTIKVTTIRVTNDRGADMLGKPVGSYITIESSSLNEFDEGIHEPLCSELMHHLKRLLGESRNILVAGLGNRAVTPDSIGPLVVDNLFITRHLEIEKIKLDGEVEYSLSAICPGVMAQTGIETVEILRGICDRIGVDAVIVIDALAARNSARLNRTIQLTDTGISPGSGVGNNRKAVNSNNIKTKVIAVGVPTVISVPSLIDSSIDAMAEAFCQSEGAEIIKSFDENQRYEMACHLVPSEMTNLFVTPKNIDELVKRISFTISEAINRMVVPSKS